MAITETQIHFYILTEFEDISLLGNFDNNIFSNPLNKYSTIFIRTPSINRQVDLPLWKKNYGLDKNSSNGPIENLLFQPEEKKLAKMNTSIYFEYTYSNSPKSVPLIGTYIDLRGKKVKEKVAIPAFSSIFLLKTKN